MKLRNLSALVPPLWSSFSALPIRLIVGYGFMEHGWAKLARGPENFAHILSAIGMPFPDLLSWATVLIELLGGFAILIGAFVPFVSVPMAFVLVAAMVTVHLPYGFSSIKLQSYDLAGAHFGQPGVETDLLYLASLVALVLGGTSPWSVDRWLSRRKRQRFPFINARVRPKSLAP